MTACKDHDDEGSVYYPEVSLLQYSMNKTWETGPEIINFNCRIETPGELWLLLISKPGPLKSLV